MPSYDGFVRHTPTHCDHNRDVFQRCDPCSAGNRRCYSVTRHGRHSTVIISILQLDTPYLTTLGELSPLDVYDLTTRLADAGWSQSTSAVSA
jgi:hypothetical protein